MRNFYLFLTFSGKIVIVGCETEVGIRLEAFHNKMGVIMQIDHG